MSIVARHLLPVIEPRRRPNHREPAGPDAVGASPRTPRTTPARALAIEALAILRLARRREAHPDRWTAHHFVREVELIRLHLRPIRSRVVLAASFGREAFHGVPILAFESPQEREARRAQGAGPVQVAYALRWLELGDGADRPAWPLWLASPDPVPGRSTAAAGSTAPARVTAARSVAAARS
jgi:hypothetical protein